MRQAITVKFLGPTDKRWIRWKATAAAGSYTMEQLDKLEPEGNARMAAQKLANKLGWAGNWYGGVVAGGEYVFVQADAPEFSTLAGK